MGWLTIKVVALIRNYSSLFEKIGKSRTGTCLYDTYLAQQNLSIRVTTNYTKMAHYLSIYAENNLFEKQVISQFN